MPGTTPVQGMRYGYDGDVISHTAQAHFADDAAAELSVLDTLRTRALKRPAVRIGATQNVPITTVTTVSFSTELWDTHGLWAIGTPTRMIIPNTDAAGIYYVSAQMTSVFGGTPWTQGEITLRKNGGNYLRKKFAGNPYRMQIKGEVWLGAAADYVDVTVYHEGGGSSSCDVVLTAHKICDN